MRVDSGRILSTSKCGGCRGYVGVNLSKDGKRYGRLVHRLVAEAFIERPDGLYEVNHKDEDKTNNSVENLEWCDHRYNMNYGTRMNKTRETRLKNGTYCGLDKKEYKRKYIQEHKEYRDKDSLHSRNQIGGDYLFVVSGSTVLYGLLDDLGLLFLRRCILFLGGARRSACHFVEDILHIR